MKKEHLTKEEKTIELERCNNGYKNMTGEEYFFYNYCKIDGKLPNENSYTREKFKEYQKNVESIRNIYTIKTRRHGLKPSFMEINKFYEESPITIQEAFKVEKQ